MNPTCMICAAGGQRWMTEGTRELWRCPRCGFGWVPQGVMRFEGVSIYEHQTPIFLRDGNEGYYLDENNLVNARAKLQWTRRFRPGGRLLDVGANFGHFAAEAAAHYEVTGIEPSRVACEWARRRFGADVRPGTIEDLGPGAVTPFDVVTMWDVIEHLATPLDALARAQALLVPGGLLCLATPDFGSVVAGAMGRRWHYLDLVQHVALFNRRNLAALLERTGFRVVAVRSFGRIYRSSYIADRLAYFGRSSRFWRVAAWAAHPLLAWGPAHLSLNLKDVMGVAAEKIA